MERKIKRLLGRMMIRRDSKVRNHWNDYEVIPIFVA